MSRTDLPRWFLALALLVAPAALRAQAPTVTCKDGTTAPAANACASHGSPDSGATSSAKKPQDPAATAVVVCKDGTAGVGPQGCAGHDGVDAVTTNASRTGRVDIGPVETGQADTTMNPSGRAGMTRDTGIRIMPDTSQPNGWGTPPGIRTDTTRAAGDSTR
jgi:hypothetical protein